MQPLTTTLLTLGILLQPSSASSYDSLCERIVSHAQAAARLHNSGEAAAAETQAVASVEAYRSAVELAPSEPQAYLYAGQAMYNMQRFDEAIGAFTAAGEGTPRHTSTTAPQHLSTTAPQHHGTSAPPHLCTSAPRHHLTGERLPADGSSPDGQPWREYIASRVRAARLGQASIARDAAYADGQGNLTEALRLVRLQLELQPRHPRYLHDAATVQARRRYLGPGMARWEPATGPSTHPPGCLSAYRFMSLSIHPSTHPPTHPPTHLPIHPPGGAQRRPSGGGGRGTHPLR